MKDVLILYRNYLYALQWAKKFGNKYGDEDAIKIYEECLANIKKENDLDYELYEEDAIRRNL